jgi:hypothetical protein
MVYDSLRGMSGSINRFGMVGGDIINIKIKEDFVFNFLFLVGSSGS